MVGDVQWDGIVLASMLVLAGFMTLCLAMPRHFNAWFSRPPRNHERLAFRCSGWVFILVAVIVCVRLWGYAVGLVALSGFATAGAFIVVLLRTYLAPYQRKRLKYQR